MALPLAEISETDFSTDGSPNIIGPTPPKRHASNSKRRLDFGVLRDPGHVMSSTPKASAGSKSNATTITSTSNTRLGTARGSRSSGGTATVFQPASPSSSMSSFSVNNSGLSSSGASSPLEMILAELHESNKHLKVLSYRMEDMDKRLKSLEDGDADDEGDGSTKQEHCKKRKRKLCAPSKDIRVGSSCMFVYMCQCMV